MSESKTPSRFRRLKDAGEVATHTRKQTLPDMVSRSYSMWPSDLEDVDQLVETLSEITQRKVKNSHVVRAAVRLLKEQMASGGEAFEREIERILKDTR